MKTKIDVQNGKHVSHDNRVVKTRLEILEKIRTLSDRISLLGGTNVYWKKHSFVIGHTKRINNGSLYIFEIRGTSAFACFGVDDLNTIEFPLEIFSDTMLLHIWEQYLLECGATLKTAVYESVTAGLV